MCDCQVSQFNYSKLSDKWQSFWLLGKINIKVIEENHEWNRCIDVLVVKSYLMDVDQSHTIFMGTQSVKNVIPVPSEQSID